MLGLWVGEQHELVVLLGGTAAAKDRVTHQRADGLADDLEAQHFAVELGHALGVANSHRQVAEDWSCHGCHVSPESLIVV